MRTVEEWADYLDPTNNGRTLIKITREEIREIQLDAANRSAVEVESKVEYLVNNGFGWIAKDDLRTILKT